MNDLEIIMKTLRSLNNKDSNAYKITKYYTDLTGGTLDDGGIVLAKSKVLNIEKYLRAETKKHPNNGSTIMQPEESALILINDLRNRGLL